MSRVMHLIAQPPHRHNYHTAVALHGGTLYIGTLYVGTPNGTLREGIDAHFAQIRTLRRTGH